jgi:DNA repair protein RadC
MTSTAVDIRLIFALALKARCTGLILGHNHPSGNTRSSLPDIKLIKKIIKSFRIKD